MELNTRIQTKPSLVKLKSFIVSILGFPDGSDSKESTCNAGDPSSIPGSGRYPGERNGNPFQYFCLENPVERGAWWAIVQGVTRVR